MAEWFPVAIRVAVGIGADGQNYYIDWHPDDVNLNFGRG